MVVVVYAPTFCVWVTFTLAYTLVCNVIMVVLLCVDCLTCGMFASHGAQNRRDLTQRVYYSSIEM